MVGSIVKSHESTEVWQVAVEGQGCAIPGGAIVFGLGYRPGDVLYSFVRGTVSKTD